MGARAWRQRCARLSDPFANFGITRNVVADQHLARLQPRKLAGKIARFDRGRDQLTGRDVERGKRQHLLSAFLLGGAEERGQEIMRARVEQALLGKRPRRDKADDVTANHRLRPSLPRLGRILELLAHGDTMTLGDETLEIVVSRAHRHAAHRNVLALMLAPLGERDAERARSDLGVLEEQLVEIAHAVEQEAIGVRRLDLEILCDHRRGAGSVFSPRGA